MNYHLMTPAEALAWLSDNILGVGLAAAVLLAILMRRAIKHGKGDTLATGVAVAIATVFSAEGMYEVATERLGFSPYFALVIFAAAESSMLASAVRAGRLHKKTGSLGIHGRAVWIIAVCAGVIVSLNSASVVEFPVRLGMPILVAALWWLGYQNEATRAKLAGAISWTVSPRRVLVWLRLAEPGDVTVTDAATERLTKRMTLAGFRLHAAMSPKAKARKTLKLQLMALKASDEVADEVAARIARAYSIVERTAPATATEPPGDEPTNGYRSRRPAVETRRLVDLIKAQEPHITQQALADRLNMSRWALRDALKGATA